MMNEPGEYEPMPPVALPPSQSMQFVASGGSVTFIPSDAGRQVPAFFIDHQTGMVGLAGTKNSRASTPKTWSMSESSTNDITNRSLPELVSHANVLFTTPPSE